MEGWDKQQSSQMGSFKSVLRKKKNCDEGVQTLAQVARIGCGIAILGDTQTLSGEGPEQPVITQITLSTRFD